ncbi:MAG TPA: hypothetical protein VIQ04_06255, partial [Nitrososphaeraceae archaeon]
YGLPKTHKDGMPLRPIVSNSLAPTYKLSKYLCDILKNVVGNNPYYLKNSFELKIFLENFVVPDDYNLVSFDVVSLYTNTPIDSIIKSIESRWNLIKNHTDLPIKDFIEAVSLVLNSTYFAYNGNIYKQHYGVAMGSPLSSVVASMVLEDIEERIIPGLHNVKFFKRYIDDCLLCIHKDHINNTLDVFNNEHPRLKFTVELEVNNQINFLDITLIKNEHNNINTKWYTKKIWTGRHINYNSYTPFRYKIATINSLVDRAVILTSPTFKSTMLKKLKNTLMLNDYPVHVIDKYVKKRLRTLTIRQQNLNNGNTTINQSNIETNPRMFASITYHDRITNSINGVFQQHSNTKLIPKPYLTLGKVMYTQLKDPVHNTNKSNIIYKVNCLDCDKAYIGQTKNYLKNRIKNHRKDIENQKRSTALANHALNEHHHLDLEGTTLLRQEQNYNKRLFLEMAYILKNNSMNYRNDIDNLSTIYFNIIKNAS